MQDVVEVARGAVQPLEGGGPEGLAPAAAIVGGYASDGVEGSAELVEGAGEIVMRTVDAGALPTEAGDKPVTREQDEAVFAEAFRRSEPVSSTYSV